MAEQTAIPPQWLRLILLINCALFQGKNGINRAYHLLPLGLILTVLLIVEYLIKAGSIFTGIIQTKLILLVECIKNRLAIAGLFVFFISYY